ncbi:serine hydrolase domain-containing protein [Mycobacterium montefiorense]|uniref:Esterase n=1 Tax=Mycobacterium montefiorense TaxID=154654 RepID=A0AA37PJ81_9MYCO|nr:serine hydrolase domain-containing protein [Mycobacterium montefiorense]GBG38536.1 esterase [Mycobacterium montefiorense]GKU34364.1 esterase [Mycobacterium montefiorense]GKU38985.1 esterase [Mycobacterium montefiorense]GKU49750.1 esterase [Mycobacterium montefiorense]GKU57547.1 esterase [Mycobacterium montefiorense]
MAQKVQIPPDLVGGDVDEGYGKVADAFRRNLSSGKEIGAAIAVYRDGRKVVDLWGGYRNGGSRTPWQQDTLVNVFSTTKGIASLAVAVAASRGYLSYDGKVTDYWPEFGQAGKEAVTVRQLLSHQAGLPVVKPPLTLPELADPPGMSAKLAAQVPAWRPGTRHGYHGITLGWYEGELIRRTDPAGRSLGRFFAEEIAGPLELDLYIGLPACIDRDRVAHLDAWSLPQALFHLNTMPRRLVLGLFNPFDLAMPALTVAKGIKDLADFNRDELRVVEMPAVNGTGTARSIAKLYGSAATGGAELGLTGGTLEALHKSALPPTKGLRDKVLHVDTTFSLGFNKPIPWCIFGSSDNAFGTPGAGGSFGFADPDTGIGYGYVMNKLGFHLVSDPRELALRNALFHDALGARPQV